MITDLRVLIDPWEKLIFQAYINDRWVNIPAYKNHEWNVGPDHVVVVLNPKTGLMGTRQKE